MPQRASRLPWQHLQHQQQPACVGITSPYWGRSCSSRIACIFEVSDRVMSCAKHDVCDDLVQAELGHKRRTGGCAHKKGERRGRVDKALKLLVELRRPEAGLRICWFWQQRLQDPADLVLGKALKPHAGGICANRHLCIFAAASIDRTAAGVTPTCIQWIGKADLLTSASCRICLASGEVPSPGWETQKP